MPAGRCGRLDGRMTSGQPFQSLCIRTSNERFKWFPKSFSVDSNQFGTHPIQMNAFVRVQMPCRLACYRSFQFLWQENGVVELPCLGGSQADFTFVKRVQCPGHAFWIETNHTHYLYQLYSDVLLHLRPGHFVVDVNYLPLSVNTAGRQGVLLVYISVHTHVLPILCWAYGSRKTMCNCCCLLAS